MAEDTPPNDEIYVLQIDILGAGTRPPIYVRVLDPSLSLRNILQPIARDLIYPLDEVIVKTLNKRVNLAVPYNKLGIGSIPFSDLVVGWKGPPAAGKRVMLARISLLLNLPAI